MAQHNQISATLSPKDMEEIMKALGVIQRKLPFLINMTFDERRTHLKMGDRSPEVASVEAVDPLWTNRWIIHRPMNTWCPLSSMWQSLTKT